MIHVVSILICNVFVTVICYVFEIILAEGVFRFLEISTMSIISVLCHLAESSKKAWLLCCPCQECNHFFFKVIKLIITQLSISSEDSYH